MLLTKAYLLQRILLREPAVWILLLTVSVYISTNQKRKKIAFIYNDFIQLSNDALSTTCETILLYTCTCAGVVFVAGLIVVDDINRGPSVFIVLTDEAFDTVTNSGVDDAPIGVDTTLPSFLIENTKWLLFDVTVFG